ncbi:MAG TPA: L-seryl-tRNA(Sec) selenium transferase [Blastocatellia bacterium]|nr:L-seryl-tRNA(Sec) selenium transferase [Blastocatellia bacterium]
MPNQVLRSLPSIERLLERPLASQLSVDLTRERVRDLLREITGELREHLSHGTHSPDLSTQSLTELVERRLEVRAAECAQPSLRRVINATGVIIHTNLGRAPLAPQAIEAISEAGANYSNLEYDLKLGERGHREAHCQELLARLAGSESAVLANNNAAAVLLVLNTLAEGGEVIVSRGELIEIGGSFRIPDVMEKSGARLREVGTTNRTRISDYERAINERTKLILRVHPSNYRIIGFTERPTVQQIAELALRAGVPSFEDLGSGCLIDLTPYGVKGEPVVAESLKGGISVVSFSGDKMLGGPQAGIIAGSREIVDKVRRNPLMRAVRADKMTYAALEATLRLYDRGDAVSEVPVLGAIASTREKIGERAARLCEAIAQLTNGRLKASLEDGGSVIGGGSAPEVSLPTVLVALQGDSMSAAGIEERLRSYRIPIITRTERDRVMIDLRTVAEDDERIMLDAIATLAQPSSHGAASVEM